jgi:signal transduction histidine kinase
VRGAITKPALVALGIVSALSLVALAGLQYRWIAQLGTSERALLDASIERGMRNFREDFNGELSTLVGRTMRGAERTPEAFEERFLSAAASIHHPQMIRALYLSGQDNRLLRVTNSGLAPVEWPGFLKPLADQLRHPDDGPPPRPFWNENPPAVALPRSPGPPRGPPEERSGPPSAPFQEDRDSRRPPRNDQPGEWAVFEFDSDYIVNRVLPDLIGKHLGAGYQVEVVSVTDQSHRLFGPEIEHPDAEAGFFEVRIERPEHREGGPPHEPPQAPLFETSRWQLRVKHQSGSLELEVAGARHRNLAVTSALLLLMALSITALLIWLRRAEELNRMQLDFVAGVSHELRTPLSVIRSAGENLADGVVASDKIRHYGALVRDEGRRLSNMVEQILRYAGVESGRAPYTFTPVSPSALIAQALEGSVAALKGIAVEQQVGAGLPNVMADEASISHCIQNLLGNAIKYGDGKWVKVEALRNGDFVEFAVTDRGPGVDPADKQNIFDPFFRGKKAIDDQVHGLGIGLSLVKRIAEAHGGRAEVRNLPQGGARFSLLIPVEGPANQ